MSEVAEVKVATPEMIRDARDKFKLGGASDARFAAMIRSAGYVRANGEPWTADDVRAVLAKGDAR